MASTLAEMSRIELVRDFRHIDPASFFMRAALAFCPPILKLFPSTRNGTWKAWEFRFSSTNASPVWMRMELSSADRKFVPQPCSGEPVSSRHRGAMAARRHRRVQEDHGGTGLVGA